MMRLLSRKEFLEIKQPVVYCKTNGYSSGELSINEESLKIDWLSQTLVAPIDCQDTEEWVDLIDKAMADSSLELPLDFNCSCRDGLFEESDLFYVYSQKDLGELIKKLVSVYSEMAEEE